MSSRNVRMRAYGAGLPSPHASRSDIGDAGAFGIYTCRCAVHLCRLACGSRKRYIRRTVAHAVRRIKRLPFRHHHPSDMQQLPRDRAVCQLARLTLCPQSGIHQLQFRIVLRGT